MSTNRVFCKYCKGELLSDAEQEIGSHLECRNEILLSMNEGNSEGNCYYCKVPFDPSNTKKKESGCHEECVPLAFTELRDISDNLHYCSIDQRLDIGEAHFRDLTYLPASIALLENLTHLYITDSTLHSFPPSFSKLTKLTNLVFGNNSIEVFPEIIFRLENLLDLILTGNKMTCISIPKIKASKLLGLNIANNQIKKLPKSITNLRALERLNIENNQIEELPAEIKDLEFLSYIWASNNRLTDLPEFSDSITFRVIGLDNNRFTKFPDSLLKVDARLIGLNNNNIGSIPNEFCLNNHAKRIYLGFQNCGLNSLPKDLGNLNILSLCVSQNNIESIPENFGINDNLNYSSLDFSDNPIKKIPKSLFVNKRVWDLNVNNTLIDNLPQIIGMDTLYIRGTPIEEFPDLSRYHLYDEMFRLDFRDTLIEKIPSYVKDIRIKEVYINNKKFVNSFHPKTKVFFANEGVIKWGGK